MDSEDKLKVVDERAVAGKFGRFQLNSVSYYPVKKVINRIMLNVYGVDLKEGLYSSEKYNREEKEGCRHIDVSVPMSHCAVEGEFILLIPQDEPACGLLDIRMIKHRRADVNLSIVSPSALMPHLLHVVRGAACAERSLFVVVDQDGSTWTLHCK
ncbi:MAG: hypothetical protein V1804_02995 [Patescibacteria group bacterium]